MFLADFVQAAAEELRRFYEETLSMSPTQRLWKRMRIMYGRGEIRREMYFQLRSKLERGQYIEGELDHIHRQAVARLAAQGRPIVLPRDPKLARNLEHVYMSRALLDEVRFDMMRALKAVEGGRNWMEEQAQDIHGQAQNALPDEGTARNYLEIRQDLIDHEQLLNRRMHSLQQDLRRVEVLEAQLRLYEAELLMIELREYLARVEYGIQKTMHS